jgi:hypothetical protein
MTITATTTITASADNGQTNNARSYTPGDMAGAAVGVGLPLLLALAAAVFLILGLRKKLQRSRLNESSAAMGWPKARDEHGVPQRRDFDLMDHASPNELDALAEPRELDSRRVFPK